MEPGIEWSQMVEFRRIEIDDVDCNDDTTHVNRNSQSFTMKWSCIFSESNGWWWLRVTVSCKTNLVATRMRMKRIVAFGRLSMSVMTFRIDTFYRWFAGRRRYWHSIRIISEIVDDRPCIFGRQMNDTIHLCPFPSSLDRPSCVLCSMSAKWLCVAAVGAYVCVFTIPLVQGEWGLNQRNKLTLCLSSPRFVSDEGKHQRQKRQQHQQWNGS